jgi:hypothetical protein
MQKSLTEEIYSLPALAPPPTSCYATSSSNMSSHPLVWCIGYISSLEYGGTLGYFSRHLVVTLKKIDMVVSKQHVSKSFLWWEASKRVQG